MIPVTPYVDGSTLYSTEDPPLTAENARVVQGMLEKSNIQGVLEVTRMIDVMRSYQSTQKMIDTGHELQRRAIDKLGRAASAYDSREPGADERMKGTEE